MKIDIKHLAKLSKLNTNPEQEAKFEIQMQDIIAMVEKLPALLSEESLVDSTNPMKCREDISYNEFKREQILSNAPQTQAGCVVVPKVIE
ncbi:MAG: Asp-tRNA(Asn)/Glu-tRNA(Gln) amidotransferase subunit GatC [Oscillospiraceae bacterium]